MIGLDWSPLEWSKWRADELPFLRGASDEAYVLADAVCALLGQHSPRRPSASCRILDFGAEPGTPIPLSMSRRVGAHMPVPIDGPESAAAFLDAWPRRPGLRGFDVFLTCHVLPLTNRPDVLHAAAAEAAADDALAVTVLLEARGDQHRAWELAAKSSDYDEPGEAWYSQAWERWLIDGGADVTALTAWSTATVRTFPGLRRLVGFSLARPAASPLVGEVAAEFPPDSDGKWRFRSAHRITVHPLRHHRRAQL